MINATLVSMVVSLNLGAGPIKADFYVAPNGNDANPGTKQAPFASLARARDAVRALVRKGLQKDVTVFVRGGTYLLDAPLVFGPEDAGTGQHAITYAACPGEKVVISGGRVIKGWKKAGGGKWTVELPDVKSGKWRFRQLFADGVRLPRGRFPNGTDLLRVRRVSKDIKQIALSQAPPGGDLAGKDAELVMYQNWSISRVAVVSSQDSAVTVSSPMGWIGHGPATTASPGKPVYVENALAFVDQPGEWYLDRASGTLTTMAGPNENPNARRFVAPKLERLVVVAGRADAPVRNIRLQGLTFEHTAWPLPSFGYLGIQAGHHGTHMKGPIYVLPPAIELTHATDCRLDRCRILHTGACGIGLGIGCQRNQVVGCELCDIGGNGIMVGWRGKGLADVRAVGAAGQDAGASLVGNQSLAADWKNPGTDAPKGNEISNCVIHRCGAVNHGAVGVYDAFCVGTKITHNLVKDMPYTGISVGFRWDTSSTCQRDCLVAYNHIHDCMMMLADGGGIYTLGLQPGTVLRGNLIHDIHRSKYAHGGAPNNGIFFDQGSKGYHVEGQIIYRTSGKPIRFNQTRRENLTWKDNSFGVAPNDPAFPKAAAAKTGPLPEYRQR